MSPPPGFAIGAIDKNVCTVTYNFPHSTLLLLPKTPDKAGQIRPTMRQVCQTTLPHKSCSFLAAWLAFT